MMFDSFEFRQSYCVFLWGDCSRLYRRKPAAKVSVSEVSAKELAESIKKAEGKSCAGRLLGSVGAPCIKKFPHFVELQKKYGEKGLVCVSISLDKLGADETFKQESVLKFLKDKGLNSPTLSSPSRKKTRMPWSKSWESSPPSRIWRCSTAREEGFGSATKRN